MMIRNKKTDSQKQSIIKNRRKQIAIEAIAAISDFKKGILKSGTALEIIKELNS